MNVRDVIAEVLGSTREVNGGELESVLTIYTPEGLAVLVENALKAVASGRDIVIRADGTLAVLEANPCPPCHGTGQVTVRRKVTAPPRSETCLSCDGTGISQYAAPLFRLRALPEEDK